MDLGKDLAVVRGESGEVFDTYANYISPNLEMTLGCECMKIRRAVSKREPPCMRHFPALGIAFTRTYLADPAGSDMRFDGTS